MAGKFMVQTGEGKIAFGPASDAKCSAWASRAMRERGGAYFVVPIAAALKSANAKLRSVATKSPAVLDAEIDAFARGISERAAAARTERKRRGGVRAGGRRDV